MTAKIEVFIKDLFCMEGSWKWAKKKMLEGYMIRSTYWVTPLKLRANPKTKVFEIDLATDLNDSAWTIAPTVINEDLYEQITTYEIFRWKKVNTIFMENVVVCKN